MSSSVLWFVARRHLAGGRRSGLLSLITWIALSGVTVGVCALVVVTAVMTGMQRDLRAKILEAAPHVLVLQQGTLLRLHDWPNVVEEARGIRSVVGAAPFILTQVSIVRRDVDGYYSQGADLYGVAADTAYGTATAMEERIALGLHDMNATSSGLPAILLGSGIADRMQLFSGDTVVVISFENLQANVMGISPTLREFEVTGTFTTGMYDYDVKNAYTTLDAAREMAGIKDSSVVSGVGVRVTHPGVAAEVADSLSLELGFPYYVESWERTNRALFSALKLEKIAMGVILFLIVLVAAFNIVSTLIMVVADRTREIGILRAMGMRGTDVMRIFFVQGMWIGVTGTVAGVLLGLAASLALGRFELIRIPPEVYFVDHLPVAINPADVAWIVGASVVVSLLATVHPARQAARLDPVEAIRHG